MTWLPNLDRASVEEAKLTSYILNPSHREGWPKGQFLVNLGFDVSGISALRSAILEHARSNVVKEVEVTGFGVKYRIDGPMVSPTGQVAQVRTVWQIDKQGTAPRFVTLKPLRAGP